MSLTTMWSSRVLTILSFELWRIVLSKNVTYVNFNCLYTRFLFQTINWKIMVNFVLGCWQYKHGLVWYDKHFLTFQVGHFETLISTNNGTTTSLNKIHIIKRIVRRLLVNRSSLTNSPAYTPEFFNWSHALIAVRKFILMSIFCRIVIFQ